MTFINVGSTLHPHSISSTSSKAAARVRRSLAADLERHPLSDPPEQYLPPEARLVAVFEVLLHGAGAKLSRDELGYLLRLDVPRARVAGDNRER